MDYICFQRVIIMFLSYNVALLSFSLALLWSETGIPFSFPILISTSNCTALAILLFDLTQSELIFLNHLYALICNFIVLPFDLSTKGLFYFSPLFPVARSLWLNGESSVGKNMTFAGRIRPSLLSLLFYNWHEWQFILWTWKEELCIDSFISLF